MTSKTGIQNTARSAGLCLGYLPEFIQELKQKNLARNTYTRLHASARHFLVWLDRNRMSIEDVDYDAILRFRNHDCVCPESRNGLLYKNTRKRSRRSMTGAGRLIMHLEQAGHIPHPGELEEGLQLVSAFVRHLATDGYSKHRLNIYRSTCLHFLAWIHQSRISLRTMDKDVLERFVTHECLCPGQYRGLTESKDPSRHVRMIERFAEFLENSGIVQRGIPSDSPQRCSQMVAFEAWLRDHRGIRQQSIRAHIKRIASLKPYLPRDASKYDAATIRSALLRRFAHVSRDQAKRLGSSMRMYLRFLTLTGVCAPALLGAVPRAPGWRLSTLPRYIPEKDIDTVVLSCDVSTRTGHRDRAILLLLARLALRASDVSTLRLCDVDWKKGLIRVCGKSRRSVNLPLPQDVGDAILDYIENARPRVQDDRIFLRAYAPYRPFHSPTPISGIVCDALDRAGIKHDGPRGAQLFRHSRATGLLRDGSSLESVGALLRHRSMTTTMIYAKVDLPMLEEVTQSWIGDDR